MSLLATVPPATAPLIEVKTTREISAPTAAYNVSIGYLRAFITVLVVAHHAALAYVPFSPPVAPSLAAPPQWWQAFPIVDAQKWGGASTIVGFNDTFFMSLMFFISGLFVWKSLQRKKVGGFLRNRALRLGVPFLGAAAIVAPIAYYATYLEIGQHGVRGFAHQWLSLGVWPAGPAWFVWLLLAFDFVAVAFSLLKPNWADVGGRFVTGLSARPIRFWGCLAVVSALAYVPLAMKFNPLSWSQFGPFAFQTSRVLLYLVYFLMGVSIGAFGIERGILASDGKLRRHWLRWSIAAIVVFLASSAFFIMMLTTKSTSASWQAIADLVFTITCATTCLAMLAIFVRFAKKSRIFDSLNDNAYGIYLVHYAFVSWLQYALVKSHLSGFTKLTVVLFSALVLSWITAALLRRIPAVARIL